MAAIIQDKVPDISKDLRALDDMGVVGMKKAAFDFQDYLQRLFETGYKPIKTGFVDLDSKINGGFLDGQLITLAGRPAMGKSLFALNLAEQVSADIPCLILSLEMSAHEIISRLICKETGIKLSGLLTGQVDGTDIAKLVRFLPELPKKKIFILDQSSIKTGFAIKVMEVFHKVYGKSLFVIDYLQLLIPDRPKANRVEEISDMTRRLKNTARDLSSSILMLSQLNRGLESRQDKRPLMGDLRESGSIEQDSDIVLSIYRDEVYNKNDEAVKGIAELGILKNRNGETGVIRLNFSGEQMAFRNFAPDDYKASNTSNNGKGNKGAKKGNSYSKAKGVSSDEDFW